MKTCRECATGLSDEANFCKNCGAKQPEKKVAEEKPNPVKKAAAKTQKKGAVTKKSVSKEPEKKKSDYQERLREIYAMTSQDNCGECGCTNCMQFAMQAASSKNSMELSDCPYIDEDDAEEFYNSFGDD